MKPASSPWIVWSLFLLGVVLTGFQFGRTASPSPTSARTPADDGEKIYMSRCMSCHQQNGQGIAGVFPPLDGSAWVQGDKGRVIRIVLQGLTGEVEVEGVTYSGAMPPWGTFLTDEDIAAVLTFVRSNWTNDAPAISTEEVAAVRAATEDRTASWTAPELEMEENMGIPGAAANPFSAPADTTRHP